MTTETKNPGAALAALRQKTEKPCAQCGKAFSGYNHQQYCSDTCRSNARHQRNRKLAKSDKQSGNQ